MRARWIGSVLMMVALAWPAFAQDRRGGSLDRVLPHVRQSVPGTFYDAEGPFFGPDGRPTYRLKWMTPDNRIIWFSVDAQTGRVLGGAPGGPPPARAREDNGWQSQPRGSWPSETGPRDDRGNWGDRSGSGWGGRGSSDNGRGGPDSGWGSRGGSDNGWGGRSAPGSGWGRSGGSDNGWGDRSGGRSHDGDRGNDRGNDRGGWGSRDGRSRDGDRGSDRGNWGGGHNDPGSHGNDNRGGTRRRNGG